MGNRAGVNKSSPYGFGWQEEVFDIYFYWYDWKTGLCQINYIPFSEIDSAFRWIKSFSERGTIDAGYEFKSVGRSDDQLSRLHIWNTHQGPELDPDRGLPWWKEKGNQPWRVDPPSRSRILMHNPFSPPFLRSRNSSKYFSVVPTNIFSETCLTRSDH